MNTVVVVGRVGRDASENFNAYDSGKTKASFFDDSGMYRI